jgi:uncharacterized protein with von Willebrand factor type A (vWA) domain
MGYGLVFGGGGMMESEEMCSIRIAISEAERFIEKASRLKEALNNQATKAWMYNPCGRERAAAKRASMDLYHQLAKFRRGE